MNEKYYIPKIEEFHIGFEYESLYIKSGYDEETKTNIGNTPYWNKEVCGMNYPSPTLPMISDGIDKKYIRVKYLDREDIESEGFIFVPEKDEEYDPCYIYRNKEGFETQHWYTDKISNAYSIELRNFSNGNKSIYFVGVLKNKFEFSKLLSQLGIK